MKAVITGSGFESASFGEALAEHLPQSSLGELSSKILEVKSNDSSFFWLRRHGETGAIAPHRINYRANIQALAELGVTQIVAVNSAGGISNECKTGVLAIPDQIIDMTWGRDTSFFDGDYLPLKHIDFTRPFDPALSQRLQEAAEHWSLDTVSPATFACVQGPRLETAAEIRAMAIQGADIVGMTVMPEAALAREMNITYSSICPIVNMAAGLGEGLLDEAELRARANQMVGSITQVILKVLQS
jgi:5'-methylthioinosine phosphorylase